MSQKQTKDGFSIIEVLIVILVVVVLAAVGFFFWQKAKKNDTAKQSATTAQSGKQSSGDSRNTSDPYAGWKTATSAWAGFSIKYPADWTYNVVEGRDNAEHITIDSLHMHITIDSYKDATDTKCPDCSQTLDTVNFTAPNLGSVDLKTVTYKLDDGTGNALVLELPDSTYYIPSKIAANVSTTFRGISVKDSEEAYQAETASEFTSNPDFKTAQVVLKSIIY
jgi:prepilin-type N-terminal cleavage/methylation domain-containing protein